MRTTTFYGDVVGDRAHDEPTARIEFSALDVWLRVGGWISWIPGWVTMMDSVDGGPFFMNQYQQAPYQETPEDRDATRLWCRYRALTETFDRHLARREGVPERAISSMPELRRLSDANARRVSLETVHGLDPERSQLAKRLTSNWSYERCLDYLEESNE